MKTPEPGRLIKCKGSDCFGDFEVVGKWVRYKGQKSGRFMVQYKYGKWIAEINMWKDATSWEYVQEAGK